MIQKIEMNLFSNIEYSESETNTMTTIEVATPTTPLSAEQEGGVFMEIEEYEDDSVPSYVPRLTSRAPRPISPVSPVSPVSPISPMFEEHNDDSPLLMRSQSSAETDPTPVLEAPKDPNITRIELGDNHDTIDLLHFLSLHGVNTTKFVTDHVMKYGCFARVAKTDDGKIVGCLAFGSETELSDLRDMSLEEAAKKIGPFIFQQLLVVDPVYAASDRWRERLIESFQKCVTKNGKIAIVRVNTEDENEIQLYQSCGFFTMCNMGIPSYASTKGAMEVVVYTPMGLEGTSQIFKKFYEMGARF